MDSLNFSAMCQKVSITSANIIVVTPDIRSPPPHPSPQVVVLPGNKNKKKKARRECKEEQ